MKYCRKCGKNVRDNAKFCAHCGTIVINSVLPLSSASVPPPRSMPSQPNNSAPSNSASYYVPPEQGNNSVGTKIGKAIVCFAILLVIVLTIGNSGLKGTYQASDYYEGVNWGEDYECIDYVTFKAFGQAEIGTKTFYMGNTKYVDSEYNISGNTIKLTARWGYTNKVVEQYTYEKTGNSIFINGVEYVKTPRGVVV